MMVIKTDSSGNMKWAKSYGSVAWEEAEAITRSYDGNYFICGSTTGSGAGSYDILLWKCDTAGNYLWGKTYGGIKTDASYSVHENADGSIVLAGYTNSLGYGHTVRGDDSTNVFLMKTDSVGNLIWMESYGSAKQDEAFHFSLMPDGGYLVPGLSNSYTNSTDSLQMLLIRTDSLGYSGCHEQRVYPVVAPVTYTPQTLPFLQSRGMVVNNVNLTALPWNIMADDACLYIGISSPSDADEPSVFPNPTNGEINIKSSSNITDIKVTNLLGQLIYHSAPKSKIFSMQLAGEGIYFVTVSSDKQTTTAKVAVVK
jgi:hypothetical protein